MDLTYVVPGAPNYKVRDVSCVKHISKYVVILTGPIECCIEGDSARYDAEDHVELHLDWCDCFLCSSNKEVV